MSLDPPQYIQSLQNNIRARPISWDGAVRAKTITEGDLKRIKSIDKVRKEQRKQTLESDPSTFTALFLGSGDNQGIFSAAAKRPDIIQYLLVLLTDIIDDNPTFTDALIQHPDPYRPFVPFLSQASNPEDSIPLLTSEVLSKILGHALHASTKTPPHLEEALPKLNNYLSTLAKSSDSGLQDIAVRQYSSTLRTRKSREVFWKQRRDTLDPLVDILRAAAGAGRSDAESSSLMNGGTSIRSMATETGLSGGVSIQLLYHVLLVFWQLSFEGELVGKGLDEDHDILPLYTQLTRVSPKEKITRLLLSTLNNLLNTNQTTLLPGATQARLPALLTNLKGRHLTDPDLLEDLTSLQNMLEEYNKSQTTFDQYASEVRSGHLRWSPPHRNQNFWKENARRIVEENKGELPKQLAEIMSKSWDSDKQVLAIGANDVAMLVKEVPDKKSALAKMGLKTRVMELMTSADESVRWEGLRAVGEWMRYSFDN